MSHDLWKYSTAGQCSALLLSLNLTGSLCLPDVKKLALLYGLSNNTKEHYTSVRIPKKSGGHRTLLMPDPILKYIQTQLLHRVLEQMPVSSCAYAYRKGVTLRDHALPHTGKEKLLKLDIHDFFGNISYISVYEHAFPSTLFPPSVRALLTSLCCYDSALPQGAPTSPYISNLVMKPFDEYIKEWCSKRGITYTRYCDDMTFSGSFHPREVIYKARAFLNRLGFELNHKKTRVYTRRSRQEVTGLTVNERPKVPKDYRRRLRQEWYYIKKFGIEEHMRRLALSESEPSRFPASMPSQNETSSEQSARCLRRFAGQVNFVLQNDPQDTYFLNIAAEVKEMFRQLPPSDQPQEAEPKRVSATGVHVDETAVNSSFPEKPLR